MKNTIFLMAAMAFSVMFVSCSKDDDNNTNSNIMAKTGLAVTGAQEVPAVTTNATGTLDVQYMKAENMLHYTLNWSNLSGAPTGMHIHGAAVAGVSAGVLQGITGFPATTTGSVTGSFTLNETTQLKADLLGGKWYVNIHTAANPGGEIRGQITF